MYGGELIRPLSIWGDQTLKLPTKTCTHTHTAAAAAARVNTAGARGL